MPKLRPARTPEEAALTPADEPVTIEIAAPEITAASTVTFISSAGQPVVSPVRTEEPTESENALRKQLEDLQRAETLARQQVQEARRREQEAMRLANEHADRSASAEAAEEESIYNGVVTAIGAAKADSDKAQTDYAVAAEAQDYAAMADAQMRMSNASALAAQSERDKNYLERQREIAKRTPKPEPRQQQPQLTVDQYIDQMNQLSPSQKNWLKQHPDALTDSVKNQGLGWAHHKAINAGLSAGSDDYFAALETELGYRKTETNGSHEPERKGNSMPMSAPVQRSAPSMTNGSPAGPTRIELTPEQREHARISGVDEVTYAKNVLRLREMKTQGHYQER